MFDLPWSIALTALCAGVGSYCLSGWVDRARAGAAKSDLTQVVHLNHAVMSVLMIAMIWWPAGVVGSGFQAAIFVAFTLAQIVHLSSLSSPISKFDLATHLLMNVAMVWMLLAMPSLMGHSMSDSGGSHHGGDAAASPAPPVPTPAWVETVNALMIAVTVAIAIWWLARLARTHAHRFHFVCHAGGAAAMATMLVLM